MEIKCPHCDEGKVELNTRVYYDVFGKLEVIGDEETVVIAAIVPCHLNDFFGDLPLNMEGEMFLGCDNCGKEFGYALNDSVREDFDMSADRP